MNMHHPAISLPYWFQLNRVEHYWFEANGKRFAYAYIRKNACTAFKTLICETSRRADFVETGLRPMRFMNKYHRIKTRRQLDQCHTRLFVYRDPYGRLVSAYLNKFVARKGHEDIFQRYQSATGQHPDDTSFRDFVTRYCIPPFSQRDKHVRPQASRLLDLPYDHAIEMGGLLPKMQDLLGAELAERYFSRPRNRTEYSNLQSSQVDMRAGDLAQLFRNTGQAPGAKAFESKELRQLIEKNYACDYALIRSLQV
ncbi:hypothetical protein XMD517_001641 [Aliiroseovarius sp. xm-d-517]|uniref:sulfotransferase family 2 domain-containing protein n=2 Tax=unclassified Aliiroseovarius TaxID=2623558 RepID=UPI001569712A|nr:MULTISPECIES: sulfotransferase family 2 domain-containing protein [unclassified Aliiroseovarius]NRP12863.1 hypothetical protein [Aliiroseovarius sp. xm-d-517]NRP60902.1 hypothetical protein [Aliiroseovarius sp. xm-a-151]NRP39896.1 hypothetical protein [Aliiroseovarius sp. xm-m-339-2]NRP43402.1 hypothetical protein [Aliiroseovarius sp. xm-m-378]NRP64273.1 hypothetical protein [Aliiroseovarius sp. xm-v-225]